MKKIIVLLLCAFFVLVFFAACEKEKPSASEDLDPAIVTPDGTQDSGLVDPPPADTCEHEWELTAFVTEETTVPFAGKFVCSKCKKVEVKSFSYTDIDVPMINITGDISPLCVVDEALSCRDARVDALFDPRRDRHWSPPSPQS